MTGGASMFDRPGIGSMAFRSNMSASLFSFSNEANKDSSIGSAGSLGAEYEESDEPSEDFAPVAIFLAGLGMESWSKTFEREKIDLEALTLLGDHQLREMGLPMGPRIKIMSAIEDRRKAMKNEQIIQDSHL